MFGGLRCVQVVPQRRDYSGSVCEAVELAVMTTVSHPHILGIQVGEPVHPHMLWVFSGGGPVHVRDKHADATGALF